MSGNKQEMQKIGLGGGREARPGGFSSSAGGEGMKLMNVQYALNVGNYQGDLYIRIKNTFAITPMTAYSAGLTGIEGTKTYIAYKLCSNYDLGNMYKEAYDWPNGDQGWVTSKPIHTSTAAAYTICFDVLTSFGTDTHNGISTPLKLATFSVDTYATQQDANNQTNRLNQVDQEFSINAQSVERFYWPLYACPSADKTTCAHALPIYSANPTFSKLEGEGAPSYSSSKYLLCASIGSTGGDDAGSGDGEAFPPLTNMGMNPKEGDVISMDLSQAQGGDCGDLEGQSVEEFYIVGPAMDQTAMEAAWDSIIDCSQEYKPGITANQEVGQRFTPVAQKPGGGNFNNSANKIVKGGESKKIIKPGDCRWNNLGQASCGEKAVSKDFLRWDKKNNDVLRAMGFTMGFTGATFTDGVFMHQLANSDGSPAGGEKKVMWTTAISAAHDQSALWALPDSGAGTRIYHGAGVEVNSPDNMKIYFEKAKFWWSIESAVNHSWQMSKLVRGVIRRTFGAGNEEKKFDGIDADGNVVVRDAATGDILKENISVISASQVELVAKEIMSHTSSIEAGVSVDELFKATINGSFSTTDSSSESSIGNTQTNTTSYSVISSIEMAGFAKWLSLDPDVADGSTGFEQWKDSISIQMAFGSGSSVKSKGTEYSMTANADGSVTVDEDQQVAGVTEMINNQVVGDGIFELQSLGITYNAEIFNGYDLSISPPTWTRTTDDDGNEGVDLTDPGMWNYSLSGELKDDITFTLGYHAGSPSLAVAGKIDILKNDAEGDADALIDWSDNSAYLNIGLNVFQDGSGYNYAPSATVAGKVAGFQANVNLLSGTKYLQRSWKKNFTQNYADFLNSPGDTFEMNFNVRGDWSDGVPVTAGRFVGKADILFRKTIADFNGVAGRLIFEVNAFAQISSGVNSSSVLNSKDAGFGATVGIKWENNILEWFGLPFNLHPSLKAGIAANYMFGGKTRDVYGMQSDAEGNQYKQKIIDGVDYEPGGSVTFVIGPVQWDITTVDSFKAELRRKHGSVFGGLGLGDCPLLNVLGPKEEVWEYVFRAGPVRAHGAVNKAQEICGGKRTGQFEKARNSLRTHMRKMEAATVAQFLQTGASGLPFCGELNAKTFAAANDDCKKAFDQSKKVGDATKVKDHKKNEACWKWAFDQGLVGYECLRTGIYQESLKTDFNNLNEPFPCKLSKRQFQYLMIDRMQKWDSSFNKCACIENEFHKLSTDRYYGRVTGVMSWDYQKWNDELQGGSVEEGVVNRGFEVIDEVILSMVKNGQDPTNTKKNSCGGISCAQHFAEEVTVKIQGIMNAVDLNAAERLRVDKALQDTYGGGGSIVEWWQEKGLCYLPKMVWGWASSAVSWLYNGIGGWFSSGSDFDAIAVAAYDSSNPCAVNVNKPTDCGEGGGGGSEPEPDNCYDVWKEWEQYKTSYKKAIHFMDESHSEDSLTSKMRTLHTIWQIPQKQNLWGSSGSYSCSACGQNKLSPSHADSEVKSSNQQYDLLKAYMIISSKDLSWVPFGNLAGAWPFSHSHSYAEMLPDLDHGPVLGTLGATSTATNGHVWINGDASGSKFPIYLPELADTPRGTSDNCSPCVRGYTEDEYNDAESETSLNNNYVDLLPILEDDLCHSPDNTGYSASSAYTCQEATCSVVDTNVFHDIFVSEKSAFNTAEGEAETLGNPYTGLCGTKGLDYLKMIVEILCDPAMGASNPGSPMDAYFNDDGHPFQGAYIDYQSIVSADFTDISATTIKLVAFKNSVNAIDTSGLSAGGREADKSFADSCLDKFNGYVTAFTIRLRGEILKKLVEGDVPLGTLQYQDFDNNRTVASGRPFLKAGEDKTVALNIYTALFGSNYNITVPTLNWILAGSGALGAIPTGSYANADAVKAAWQNEANRFAKGVLGAIKDDPYVKQFGGTLADASVTNIKTNSKTGCLSPCIGGMISGKELTGPASVGGAKFWHLHSTVSWSLRQTAILRESGVFAWLGYNCKVHNLLHASLGSAITGYASLLDPGWLDNTGQNALIQYVKRANPDWWDSNIGVGPHKRWAKSSPAHTTFDTPPNCS